MVALLALVACQAPAPLNRDVSPEPPRPAVSASPYGPARPMTPERYQRERAILLGPSTVPYGALRADATPNAVRRDLLKLTPLGTPIDDARTRLTLNGFACNGAAGASSARGMAYICRGPHLDYPGARAWRVELVAARGKLADVRVKPLTVSP